MSVLEVNKVISGSKSEQDTAVKSGVFYDYADDSYAELGIRRGGSYELDMTLQGTQSAHIRVLMIGHHGSTPSAMHNRPFMYVVEALPQNMGLFPDLSSTVPGDGNIVTMNGMDGIITQEFHGDVSYGDIFPSVYMSRSDNHTEVGAVQDTSQTHIKLYITNRTKSIDDDSLYGASNSNANAIKYAGQQNTVAGQAAHFDSDALYFTAYIEIHTSNGPLQKFKGKGHEPVNCPDHAVLSSVRNIMGGRGVLGGGYSTTAHDTMQYFTIGLTSDAVDFNEMTAASYEVQGSSSNGTRVVIPASGAVSATVAATTLLNYTSIRTSAEAKDFGDTTEGRYAMASGYDGHRAVMVAGTPGPGQPNEDTMDYYRIGIPNGGCLDFGELSGGARHRPSGALNDGAMSFFWGGYTTGVVGTGDYVSCTSLGNSMITHSLPTTRYCWGLGDGSRGIVSGGNGLNVMEFFNLRTQGAGLDFGNLNYSRGWAKGLSDGSRGLHCGGIPPSGVPEYSQCDYITIGTIGNASEYGESVGDYYGMGGESGD